MYDVVDVKPMFPGGDAECMAYVARNMKYPSECLKNGVTGRVLCSFVIDTDGSLCRIEAGGEKLCAGGGRQSGIQRNVATVCRRGFPRDKRNAEMDTGTEGGEGGGCALCFAVYVPLAIACEPVDIRTVFWWGMDVPV